MKLAVVHYHLNQGGVTRVIENQLLALDRSGHHLGRIEVLILHDGHRDGWPADLAAGLRNMHLRLLALPSLTYDTLRESAADDLTGDLAEALSDARFHPDDTIVHVHNHSLGKCRDLPGALACLAAKRYRLLLQIHDFAEDQRPSNYRHLAATGGDWHRRLYPQASHIHYAVLNARDRKLLHSAGVPEERLHFLPNPVLPPGKTSDRDRSRTKLGELFGVESGARYLLYPVRGIRRKNMGEALLHSLLAPEGTVIGTTLSPQNPAERTRYEQWKLAGARWRLPFRFEVGAPGGLAFDENLAAADAILTTSVAEGFGMAYLESWLARRLLLGRDLPEITEDFTSAGLELPHLRATLDVPADWIDRELLRQSISKCYRAMLVSYGRPQTIDVTAGLDAKIGGEAIDFGDLDETFQMALLDRVVGDAGARRELSALNAWVGEAATAAENGALIEDNARFVEREFSLRPSGERLVAIYTDLLDTAADEAIAPLEAPERLLEGFLDLKRFRMLRN